MLRNHVGHNLSSLSIFHSLDKNYNYVLTSLRDETNKMKPKHVWMGFLKIVVQQSCNGLTWLGYSRGRQGANRTLSYLFDNWGCPRLHHDS